jgi:hypothetical protein
MMHVKMKIFAIAAALALAPPVPSAFAESAALAAPSAFAVPTAFETQAAFAAPARISAQTEAGVIDVWGYSAAPAPPEIPASEICAELGILRGDGNGVDHAYLSKTSNRMQAIYLTLRMAGKEIAAENYTGQRSFADAGLVTDFTARRLLAYAKANPQYGWSGDQAGNIDPFGPLTAQAMYKVLLTVLGYELNEAYEWKDTVAFAGGLGLASAGRKQYLTNSDLAAMITEALKTRRNNSEDTLAEYFVGMGVIDGATARKVAILPGSKGFRPILSYGDGGPLLMEATSDAPGKKISIKFNTQLNPTYAKATRNYRYYIPGVGYVPLPSRCATTMPDEFTVVIQFPSDGWAAFEDSVEKDAFVSFIATQRRNELRISGLQDVDGNSLRDLTVDVPAPPAGGESGDGAASIF